MSTIDIVIPCYRYGHFLRQCANSVLEQSFQDFRVLIINDASPDNSAEVAESLAQLDGRISVIHHASNLGHIATFNEGIDWTSSPYMLLLSADDYLLPGALDRAAALLDSHPEVGFVYGRTLSQHAFEAVQPSALPEAGENTANYRIMTGLEFILLSGARNIVRTPTVVVRTSLLKRLGGYRADLPHSGDMEMWLRLAAHAEVGFIDSAQAVYRIHADNMSHGYMAGSALLDLSQRKAAFECFFETAAAALPESAALQKRLFKLLAGDALALAGGAYNHGKAEEAEQLRELGIRLYPPARFTAASMKLSCKRWLSRGVRRRSFLNALLAFFASLRIARSVSGKG